MKMPFLILSCLILLSFPALSQKEASDEKKEEVVFDSNLDFAQVVFVRAVENKDKTWTFHTTVRHNDEGWDHYADLWEIVNRENEEVIGKRVLLHPHDTEQPFTRSLGNVEIPEGIEKVIVRAKCNVHGFEGKSITVDLTASKGDDFEIIHSEKGE